MTSKFRRESNRRSWYAIYLVTMVDAGLAKIKPCMREKMTEITLSELCFYCLLAGCWEVSTVLEQCLFRLLNFLKLTYETH